MRYYKNDPFSICKGVEYLHNHCIIHRDLKPNNILLKNEDNKLIIKICDFGLAKILGVNEIVNDFLGTIYFLAPEVILGKEYNKKVDIWSLGIIFYCLLYNNLPYDTDNSVELSKMICKDDYILHN
jgi:serine/threonine protein kinase